MTSTSTAPKRPTSYADLSLSREECMSIIELSPRDIRYLPPRLIDNGLAAAALRLGARPEDIPSF